MGIRAENIVKHYEVGGQLVRALDGVSLDIADGEYVTIPDRKEAIAYCMKNAKDGDIVVLAGKGHEDYQEIRGVKHHMDERELIAEIIQENPDLEL